MCIRFMPGATKLSTSLSSASSFYSHFRDMFMVVMVKYSRYVCETQIHSRTITICVLYKINLVEANNFSIDGIHLFLWLISLYVIHMINMKVIMNLSMSSSNLFKSKTTCLALDQGFRYCCELTVSYSL